MNKEMVSRLCAIDSMPVEENIGEAADALTVWSPEQKMTPRGFRKDEVPSLEECMGAPQHYGFSFREVDEGCVCGSRWRGSVDAPPSVIYA